MSYSIHETPGRLRIKSPALRRDPEACARASDCLADMPGVRVIVASADRGSLTVRFFPEMICPSEILNELSRRGFLAGVRALPRAQRGEVSPFRKPSSSATPMRRLAPVLKFGRKATLDSTSWLTAVKRFFALLAT